MVGAALLLVGCGDEAQSPAPPAASLDYAGSEACAPCHEAETRAWQSSHHAHAERAVRHLAHCTWVRHGSARRNPVTRPVTAPPHADGKGGYADGKEGYADGTCFIVCLGSGDLFGDVGQPKAISIRVMIFLNKEN